jgi:hypothetical protein
MATKAYRESATVTLARLRCRRTLQTSTAATRIHRSPRAMAILAERLSDLKSKGSCIGAAKVESGER